MSEIFALDRFVAAQSGVYQTVAEELRSGRKTSHWMWFVFPQMAGLGGSDTARHFAISSLEEARAYLAHPLLGPRLIACTRLVNQVEGKSAHDIFGTPDDLKFRSSMTLFGHADPEEAVFEAAIGKYFAGEADARTLQKFA